MADNAKTEGVLCQLCYRFRHHSDHHLIPREARKLALPEHLRKCKNKKVKLCHGCHTWLHKTWRNDHLALHLNTIELIQATPEWAMRASRITQFSFL